MMLLRPLLQGLLAAAAVGVLCPRCLAIDAPASPNAQPGVAATMQFFSRISGRYVVSGQQEFPGWVDELSTNPAADVDFKYIRDTTGKTPGVRGFDFLFYTHSAAGRAGQHSTERAIAWARQGGIVMFSCHLFMDIGSPANSPQFYVPAANNGVGTTFDIRQAVIGGTPENQEYLRKLDLLAAELTKLRDANVTVIWRPFHECSGGWFWWGAHGPEPLKQAWHIMFDRFTRVHRLNNLVWCFNPTDPIATNVAAWYPGDPEVDMLSLDLYPAAGTHPTNAADFRALRDFRGGRKPVVMSENGAIPDPAVMFGSTNQAAGWGFFCTWNGFENDPARNAADFLRSVYSSPYVLNLDALPEYFAAFSLAVTTQPLSQRVNAGDTLTLSVETSGGGRLAYQWFRDGSAIPGAIRPTYTRPGVTASDAGRYTVMMTGSAAVATSDPAEVAIAPAGAPAPLLVNIATRAYCSTDNRVAIGGFVVGGGATKRYLIRAVGPSLTAQQLGAAEVLADPTIEVYHGGRVVAQNDNWGDNPNAADITATAVRLGAQPLLASDTRSAALLEPLEPGVYTFMVKGRNHSSGIALLEVYDADKAETQSRFVDIATRAHSTQDNGVTIGGFVIEGRGPKRVLMRAVGPTLLPQGFAANEVLADPTIELHHGHDTVATNDDWAANANANEIRTVGARIGATPFVGTDTTSSALLTYLDPGAYSFIARGKNGTTGVVLVEVYDAD